MPYDPWTVFSELIYWPKRICVDVANPRLCPISATHCPFSRICSWGRGKWCQLDGINCEM